MAKAKNPPTDVQEHPISWMSPSELQFDARNPRLAGYLTTNRPTQDQLIRVLWEQMAVDELAMSIAASGFFDFEPLFAVRESKRIVVIEGNRRLAAVKLLLDDELRKAVRATDLPAISPGRAKSLESLPVILLESRKEAWPYLGFKHVNGPAKWDSYPKAQYIAEVRDAFGIPLTEIAAQIGDKHQTVQRLYRALMVIDQAEREGVFQRENRFKRHFAFSHLYTGLDYDGIAEFLNVKDESSETVSPVPKGRLKQLGELCTWLYGDKSAELPPVVESQNPHLRQLDEVLRSAKALDSLRAGLPLGVALEVSYGDERLFHNSLIQAKDSLQKARGTLSNGFRGEEHLIRLGQEIAELAIDLRDEMARKSKRRPSKESRL